MLVFDKKLDFKNRQLGPDVLVIYPESKRLTMPNISHEVFIKIDAKSAHQVVEHVDDVGVVNNTVLYADPPIKQAIFYDKKVVFNTYGPLKHFGDSVICETALTISFYQIFHFLF